VSQKPLWRKDFVGNPSGIRIRPCVVKAGRERTKGRVKSGFFPGARSSMGENGCHRRQPFGNRATERRFCAAWHTFIGATIPKSSANDCTPQNRASPAESDSIEPLGTRPVLLYAATVAAVVAVERAAEGAESAVA
jgi:hypothetical protein